ncbi:hypothetical protein CDZ97_11285 [Mameliella alba]|uniref:hypothetical protein n=1 Tax=Mameliella alba TaxID=561184 RepID=UPI000B52ED93|nr:hypothetical protein [Mameliella alba]OWV64448.1 hypothetical protein CDZ97_11285 [Mameliella alba]
MATLASTSRSQTFTVASASAGPFDLSFRLFSHESLLVFVNGAKTTGFTVSSTFVNSYDDAATITFDSALSVDDEVAIEPYPDTGRPEDLLPGPNLVENMNAEEVRQMVSIADVYARARRSPGVLPGTATQDLVLPEPSTSRTIVGRADGLGWETGPELPETVAYNGRTALANNYSNGGRDDGSLITDGRLLYVAEEDATATGITGVMPFMPGFGDAHLYHFGENTTPGTTDMTAAVKRFIDWNAAAGGGKVLIWPQEEVYVDPVVAGQPIFTVRHPMVIWAYGELDAVITTDSLTSTVFLVQPEDPMDGDILRFVNFHGLKFEQQAEIGAPPTSSRAIVYDRSRGTIENCHFRNWFRHIELRGTPEGVRVDNSDLSSTISFDLNTDTAADADSSAHIAILARKMTPGLVGSYHDLGEINITARSGGTFTVGKGIAVDSSNYGKIVRIQTHDDGTECLTVKANARVGHFYEGDTLTEYDETEPPFSTATGVTATATQGTGVLTIDYDNLAGGVPTVGNALVLDASNYGRIIRVRESTATVAASQIDLEITGTISNNDSLTEYEETSPPFSTATGVTLDAASDQFLGGNFWVECNSVYLNNLNKRAGALEATDATEFTLLIDSMDGLYCTNSHIAWGDTACVGIFPRQYNISCTNIQINNTLIDPLPLDTRSLYGVYIHDAYELENSSASDLMLTGGTVIAGCSSHALVCDIKWAGMTFADGVSKLVGEGGFVLGSSTVSSNRVTSVDIDWKFRNIDTEENGFACLHLLNASRVRADGLMGDTITDLVYVPTYDSGTGIGPVDVSLGGLFASGIRSGGKVVNAETSADYWVDPNGHSSDETPIVNSTSTLYLSQIYGKFRVNGTTTINNIDTTCLFDGREFTLIFEDALTINSAGNIDLNGLSSLTTEAGMVLTFVNSRSDTVGLNKVQLVSPRIFSKSGTATDTTDGSGNISITHGLTAAPGFASVQIQGDNTWDAVVQAVSSSAITVRVRDTTDNSDVTSQSVTVGWRAEL